MKEYKIAVVSGAGAMGTGIAWVLAKYLTQCKVYLTDLSQTQLDKARIDTDKWSQREFARSGIAGISDRLILQQNLPSEKPDLLLEAVSENLEIKKKVFAAFAEVAGKETIVASNTSSLSITTLATVLPKALRQNMIGLHFFNPPRIMKLIEIITCEDTSPETVEHCRELTLRLEKTPVVCKDSPGFITSRLGIVLLNEAIFALQEGLATAEEIDTAAKLGYNHPMGPLQLADFIGLDVVFAVTQTLYENFQDSKYRPCMLLRKKVEAGHLGKKTGRGFYTYSDSNG